MIYKPNCVIVVFLFRTARVYDLIDVDDPEGQDGVANFEFFLLLLINVLGYVHFLRALSGNCLQLMSNLSVCTKLLAHPGRR